MYRQPAEKLQLTKSDREVVAAVRSSGMFGVGHFRRIQPVLAAGRLPLGPKSGPEAVRSKR